MIAPDANIILYAYNEDAPKHSEAKKWLEEQLSLPVSFGLSCQVKVKTNSSLDFDRNLCCNLPDF